MKYDAINAARRRALDSAEVQRTSEVARVATELAKATPGMTRTEALRLAERIVRPMP